MGAEIKYEKNQPELFFHIPNILHGPKNVFLKKRYLNRRKDYQSYTIISTSTEKVKSYTVLYNESKVLRRFYTGIPSFIPADSENRDVKVFRNYIADMNKDIVSFLSERLNTLKDPDNPLGLYIIPELISNGAKANYVIEKKNKSENIDSCIVQGLLEIVCTINRKKPGCVDIIFRNYAQFHQDIEKSIINALHCHWTNGVKFKKEKIHRYNNESSEYGLPSIKNALKKYYNGELVYDGYDDSYSDFGAYQFTVRLPENNIQN